MTMPEQPLQGENTYVLDSSSATEMARLMLQDRLLNQMIGGLFPEQANLDSIHRVLDIGCGPGGWALDVALSYQHMEVVGIDISPMMINYACEQVNQHGLKNIEFKMMDALQETIAFPDDYFDLINIRAAIGYVPRKSWQHLIKECFRMTRPGGILRLSEGDRIALTTSAAFETYFRYCAQYLYAIEYGHSADGFTYGITPVIGKLLKDAGYTGIAMKPYALDFSYGTSFYTSQMQNIATAFKSMQPRLLQQRLVSQNELEELYEKMLHELASDDFCAIGYFITILGEKFANV